MASVADTVIVPLQDVLGLAASRARMKARTGNADGELDLAAARRRTQLDLPRSPPAWPT